MNDREHIVQLDSRETERLRKWLEHPTGGLPLRRVTFEAVENGGILVRTKSWSLGAERRTQ